MLLLLTVSAAPLAEMRSSGLKGVVFGADFIPVAWCALVALVMLACVVRWTGRYRLLKRAGEADAEFTSVFRSSAHVLAPFQEGKASPDSPRSALYMNACRELAYHLLGTDAVDRAFASRLRAAGRILPSQWEAVNRAARRSFDESARWIRAELGGAEVRLLPGLGLAGTLVALMGDAGAGTLDAMSVASSLRPLVLALLCHAAGLVCLQLLAGRAEEAVARVEDFSMELGMIFERSFVDFRQPMEALPSLGGMGMTDGPRLRELRAGV